MKKGIVTPIAMKLLFDSSKSASMWILGAMALTLIRKAVQEL